MNREIVNPLNKPTPVLSPAVKIDNLVYTAGQVGVNPETGDLAGSGIREQTKQVMENIKLLLILAFVAAFLAVLLLPIAVQIPFR